MGRGVEKARVAFAAAENGAENRAQAGPAQAVQQLWEVPERALRLSVASEGGGMAKRSGFRVSLDQWGFSRVDFISAALSS